MNSPHRGIIRVLLVALTLATAGCYAWNHESAPLSAVLKAHPGKRVRVTVLRSAAERTTCVIDNPRIEGDMLVGSLVSHDEYSNMEDTRPPGEREQVAVPLSSVLEVRVFEYDARRTMLLVAGAGFTALMIAALILEADEPEPSGGGSTWGDQPISCPVVWSWDGAGWRLDSGTFGGAIAPALARTDVDNLDFARPENGRIRLRVGNILDETEHVDALRLLRVAHAPGVAVAPDGTGRIRTLRGLVAPSQATDLDGHDVLASVLAGDDAAWESRPAWRDTASLAGIRDGLELTFPRPAGARRAKLVVDGNNTVWADGLMHALIAAHGRDTERWYASLAFPSVRARTEEVMREGFLTVFVMTAGGWQAQGTIREAGPEVMKRQVADLDLSGVPGESVRVRLETIPSFWRVDRVALDASEDLPCEIRELALVEAVDRAGRDLRTVLTAADGAEIVMETGDLAWLTFADEPAAEGEVPSYVLLSTGWYRVHTAESGDPDVGLLRRLATEPLAASRLATERRNEALRALAEAAP